MGHFPLRPPNRERLALRKGVLEVPSSRAAMAQAVASMVGLRGSSQAVLEGKLHLTGSTRLGGAAVARPAAVSARRGVVRAQLPDAAEPMAPAGRRAILGITAAALTTGCLVQGVLADAQSIKVGPPPPPSGGLHYSDYIILGMQVVLSEEQSTALRDLQQKCAQDELAAYRLSQFFQASSESGTLNSDQARDLELKLKDRFYLQPLAPADAAARAKESANAIINVKALIDKKAWPYVQNDLRSKASYLRYDLNTIISSKSKDEKKALKELTKILFEKIDALDYAAKTKNAKNAEKYYAETKASLDDVLAKIG